MSSSLLEHGHTVQTCHNSKCRLNFKGAREKEGRLAEIFLTRLHSNKMSENCTGTASVFQADDGGGLSVRRTSISQNYIHQTSQMTITIRQKNCTGQNGDAKNKSPPLFRKGVSTASSSASSPSTPTKFDDIVFVPQGKCDSSPVKVVIPEYSNNATSRTSPPSSIVEVPLQSAWLVPPTRSDFVDTAKNKSMTEEVQNIATTLPAYSFFPGSEDRDPYADMEEMFKNSDGKAAMIRRVSQTFTDEDSSVFLLFEEEETDDRNGNDIIHPKVAAFKRRRKRRTVAAGIVGGVAGAAIMAPAGLSPVGLVVGILGGAGAAKAIGKRRERKLVARIAKNMTADDNAQNPQQQLQRQDSVVVACVVDRSSFVSC